MATTMGNTSQILEDAVKRALKEEIDKNVDQAIEKALKEVEERVREAAAMISLRVLERVSFRFQGNELIISVSTEGLKLREGG